MKITYYGQSCFTVETAGHTLLFDPFISGNPLAKHIDVDSIAADFILVSHSHGDHIADLVPIAKRTGAKVITMVEAAGWFSKNGLSQDQVVGINFGSSRQPFGRLSFVPAQHSASMPDGSYGGTAGGFIISNDEGAFYFAGDTSLSSEMQLVPRYAKLNFALLPIGGFYTMDVQDAVIAAELIECKNIVGIHYDSFPPIAIDKEEATRLFADAGFRLHLPIIGGSLEF
jgi:L-ascorbate metabolism protein UlaG (beta-lactamase superfamily)